MAPLDAAPRGTSRHPLVGGLLAAALAEGSVAALGATDAGASMGSGLVAALAACGLALAAGLVPSLLLATLADRSAVRRLGRGLRYAVAGSAPLAALALLMVAGIGALVATFAGPAFAELMTERFAAVATGLATVVAVAVSGMLSVPAVDALGRALPGGGRGRGAFATVTALIAAATFLACAKALPDGWAPAPTAYVLGFAAGSVWGGAVARGPREAIALTVAAALAASSVASLDALPGAAKSALLYQAPYVGNLLSLASGATDADGDGYGAHFLGGDCDDTRRSVHPGAEDVPGNHIDENCTGADAELWTPPPAPTITLPGLPSRQNIVLIMIDALRPDHLSFAGYERPTSPNLDRFFREAVWFDNAYTAAPSTRFAMTAAFTGLDPRHAPHRDLGGNRFELEDSADTVAEALSAAGYQTAGYTITYVVHHNRGLGQGFSEWRAPWEGDWAANYPVAAERTTDASLAVLEGFSGEEAQPYLLFAHYRCTHDPYIAYEEFPYGNAPMDRYDSALNYCDQEIGRLLEGIDARDDHGRTTVVVFSDHGEMFGEHGKTSHGTSLYENDIRILLSARIPTIEGRRISTPVSLTDLAPTVRQLAGLEPASRDGWSLLLHLRDDPLPDRPLYMFTDLWRGNVHIRASGVLDWPLKLTRDIQTGTVQMFDVESDPAEAINLSGSRPRDRRALETRLERYEGYVAQ